MIFLNGCKQLGVYPKFLIFKLLNVSNKGPSSIRQSLLRSAINKRNKELQHVLKKLSVSKNFLSVQKSLYTQLKKLSSLMRGCSLPKFTANKTITKLMQYELSQEESDLLEAGSYFSIQPDKTRKSETFTTFEKIHRSFINNLP